MKIYTRYNEQKNCIDITLFGNSMIYQTGSLLRLDCGKWEEGIRTTANFQNRLDALAVDNPLEYARLALAGEMQIWIDAQDDLGAW